MIHAAKIERLPCCESDQQWAVLLSCVLLVWPERITSNATAGWVP